MKSPARSIAILLLASQCLWGASRLVLTEYFTNAG